MKREKRALLKEIEKIQAATIKAIAKEFGLKYSGGFIFKKEGDFFVFGYHITKIIEDESFVNIFCEIKPYSYDDLFWGIFEMKEAKQAPLSLRANGAFVSPSFKIEEFLIGPNQLENIESSCRVAITRFVEAYENFINSIDKSVEEFNQKVLKETSKMFNLDLGKMLAEIHLGRKQDALKRAKQLIDNGDIGRLQCGGKGIYEYVVDFCEKNEG